MRRADRLFRLLLELRHGRVITARRLADRLEVSERTIYRDVADLSASGVPIFGEAGVGYRLQGGFEVPPLMFDREEIEALVFGIRTVEAWGDERLAAAAREALAKIEAALPRGRAAWVEQTHLYVPTFEGRGPAARLPLSTLREALFERRKIRLDYQDREGQASDRAVRPLALTFFPPHWLLVSWCELRNDFRSFRVDRCAAVARLDETFADEPGKTLPDFLARMRAQSA